VLGALSHSGDEFTPFGYLRNPGHRASSWGEVEGGNLRTATDWLGVEWVYPLQRDPVASRGIRLQTSACQSRADFTAIGLTSRYHSANVIGFDWHADGWLVAARFFLIDDDALCCRLLVTNTSLELRQHDITIMHFAQGDGAPPHAFIGQADVVPLQPGDSALSWTVLARGEEAAQHAQTASGAAAGRYEEVLADDARFAATCPRLSGDWPAGWREGLHYDLQTTRLLVQPPGGIFEDVWPAWMSAWPRVVLAEGTLDMLRLGYADPDLAQRAILSMFRDAPMPNVPCVFEGGGYNMVAADGSRCGTSPAWCLPFLNLELLYLRTLDRQWLGQLFPYLAAYLEFWLAERTDAEGGIVYKCTWESGEDGNPRLDPSGSGDGVISSRIRPVELQATFAHAAAVMALFAVELGLDASRWRELQQTYLDKTRALFDPAENRFRDWLIEERRFQPSRPEQPYWGTDSCRYSPLGLTPLLLGEHIDADEIWRHAQPPWTWWPSWTYALVESAASAGHFQRVGETAASIVDRVYRVTTRHDLGSLPRPLPGAAPEFWPEDWRTYQGHDAYGWGATTANLLIRHVFGFKESRLTDRFAFELTPALPRSLLQPGRRFGIQRLNYRGLLLDVDYLVESEDPPALTAEVRLPSARACRVSTGADLLYEAGPSAHYRFPLQHGASYRVELS
jgi:hypothetical protein